MCLPSGSQPWLGPTSACGQDEGYGSEDGNLVLEAEE